MDPSLAHSVLGSSERIRSLRTRSASARLELAARSLGADRRTTPRWPAGFAASLQRGSQRAAACVIDISASGARLTRPPGWTLVVGEPLTLAIDGIGPVRTRLAALGPATLSVSGAAAEPEGEALRRASLAALEARHGRVLANAASLAADIAAAFEQALDSGATSHAILFSARYGLIPGTEPRQFRHPAAGLFEAVLPPLLARHHAAAQGSIYAVAVDRNGFVPVHQPEASQPQRANDLFFNHAHCRDRRIHDDRWTLLAARFSRGPMVQAVQRDVPGGDRAFVTDASAPIMVFGRRWGAARLGRALAGGDDVSPAAGCAAPSPA